MRLRLLRLVVVATSAALAMIAHEHAALAEEPALRSDVTGTNAALTVAAGASSLKLLDFPFVGGHALAGISSELTEHFSLGGEAEYVRTSSPNGLLLQVIRLDLTPTFVVDRFRIGVGVNVDWLGIGRETGGGTITHFGFGLHARASFDVVRLGRRGGVFVALEPSYDSFGAPALYDGNVSLGARF
jgi:hypothetical protein